MLRSLKGLYHFLVAAIAVLWFRHPGQKLTVIGVTGTDGKTTTTSLIYHILKTAGYKVSMISSVHAVIAGKSYDTGFHVTTPDAWYVQKYLREAVNNGDTHMVLEVTSHGLAQHRVMGIPFRVGVITNVTHEHLDWHGSFAQYLKTKISLLRRSKVAILNRDEDVYQEAMPFLRDKQVVTYAIRREAKITPKTYPFKMKLMGEFNRYNCLAAIAATSALGVPLDSIQKAIAGFMGIPGRMEVVAVKPFTVIVDFAHTPNAIMKALKTARQIAKRKRLIHVFGSAGLRDYTKRPLMGKASSAYADRIVLTEEDYRTESVEDIMDQIASGIEGQAVVYRYPKRVDAIAFALSQAQKGDVVIITGKGHERSLCRGTKEYPWSDQEAVRKILQTIHI